MSLLPLWVGDLFFKKNLLKEPSVLGLKGFSWTLLASQVFSSGLDFKAEVLPSFGQGGLPLLR